MPADPPPLTVSATTGLGAPRRVTGMKRFAWVVALGVIGVAVGQELQKPADQRTWTGELGGVVPYDLRLPTPERLLSKVWAPDDPRIFTPYATWGVGWSVNVGRLVKLAGRGLRSS